MLQNHARNYNLPIDELNFRFKVMPMYRDQLVVAEALRTLSEDNEPDMDEEVQEGGWGVIPTSQTSPVCIGTSAWFLYFLLLIEGEDKFCRVK